MFDRREEEDVEYVAAVKTRRLKYDVAEQSFVEVVLKYTGCKLAISKLCVTSQPLSVADITT